MRQEAGNDAHMPLDDLSPILAGRLLVDTQSAVYELVGELDLTGCTALAMQLDRAVGAVGEGQALVVDLNALQFIDSSGLRALMDAATRARALGRRLQLVNANVMTMKVMRLTGLIDALDVSAAPDV